MGRHEAAEGRQEGPDAPETRLAEAAKQLRIARDALEEEGSGHAHVELAIREVEAARHHVE